MIKQKCDLNIDLTKKEHQIIVDLELLNITDSAVEFSTSSSQVFHLKILDTRTKKLLWEYLPVQTFAVRRWRLKAGESINRSINISFPEKERKRLEKSEVYSGLFDDKEKQKEAIKDEVKRNSIDLSESNNITVKSYVQQFNKDERKENEKSFDLKNM